MMTALLLVTHAALTILGAWALEIALTAAATGFTASPAMIARSFHAPARPGPMPAHRLAADIAFPPILIGLTALPALLVAGFALGSTPGALADWPTILGLLTLGRLILFISALESGTTAAALDATWALRVSVPALAVAGISVLALGLNAGSLDLTRIAAADDTFGPTTPRGLVIAALALAALADVAAGSRLAGGGLERASEALRRMVWINLMFILLGGAADDRAGAARLLGGALRWLGWLAAVIVICALARAALGQPREHALRRPLLGAVFLGACACLLALAQTAPS